MMLVLSLPLLALVIPLIASAGKVEHRGLTPNPSVTVQNGTYYGLHNPDYDQDFFLGMPYAQQPVGELRLQTPRPMNASWPVPRNATEYSPACVGFNQTKGASEACLTLNVVRPASFALHRSLPVAGQ